MKLPYLLAALCLLAAGCSTVTALDDRCRSTLNRFTTNHPNNIRCEVKSDGNNTSYRFTDQSGNILVVDPAGKATLISNQ